jgi:hypothetical protein
MNIIKKKEFKRWKEKKFMAEYVNCSRTRNSLATLRNG